VRRTAIGALLLRYADEFFAVGAKQGMSFNRWHKMVMLILDFGIWIADCNALEVNAKRLSWSLNPKSEI
jgi:hypothetical protein